MIEIKLANMSKNLMLLFKLKTIYSKNMNIYLLSHITLSSGRKLHYRLIPRASFIEDLAFGINLLFHLPWASISWAFSPELHYRQSIGHSKVKTLCTIVIDL